jgi:hypothetical protein
MEGGESQDDDENYDNDNKLDQGEDEEEVENDSSDVIHDEISDSDDENLNNQNTIKSLNEEEHPEPTAFQKTKQNPKSPDSNREIWEGTFHSQDLGESLKAGHATKEEENKKAEIEKIIKYYKQVKHTNKPQEQPLQKLEK